MILVNFRMILDVHKTKIKIVISILIIISILGIIIYKIVTNPENNIPFFSSSKASYTSIQSSDNIIKLTFNDSYGLNNKPSDTHVLYLTNSDDFLLSISKVQKYNFDLKKILESDMQTFLKSLGNYSNLSTISDVQYTNISGYIYSLNYTSDSAEYKLYEFITEINGALYFFDIRFPTKYESKYENLKDEILNSISF